ncbi:hypothetical protein IFR05_008463, partial [Cadophora sp. M221]
MFPKCQIISCRQRVEALLDQPSRSTLRLSDCDLNDHTELGDFDALLEGVFLELQEYDEGRSRQQRVLEQLPEMRPHRSKQRNLLKVDRMISWIESTKSELLWIDGNNLLRRHDFNASFADPLLILGQSNCERYLILRHFCGENYAEPGTGYRTLIQSLLRQIFKQYPEIFKSKAALLTREQRTSRIMIDQNSRSVEVPPPGQEFEDQFPETKTSHLKPLFLVTCPAVIAAYVLAQ